MESSVIIILLVTAATASVLACVFAAKSAFGRNKGNTSSDAKIDLLSSTLSSEMAINRNETARAMGEVRDRISEMSEKNADAQLRLTTRINNSLSEIRDSNASQNEKLAITLEASVDKMTDRNEKKLEEMRATVDEKLSSTLTQRLDSSFKTVSEQLEKLYSSLGEMKELSGGITENVTSLSRVLTNVKARGTWAEYQLEAILDQTVPGMYVKNYRPPESRDFVEFAVTIPPSEKSGKTTYLPIDSKFPMEDYARLCEAADRGDAESTEEARRALEKRIIAEAKEASKYISVPETTPFAILYLATEGLYAEAASSKACLIEKLQNDYSVMIAGPSTVTALLNSVAMGFKSIAINEKANEISLTLAAVKKQYDIFDATLKKVKKKINEADAQLDEAAKRNEIIQKKLRNIEAASESDSEILLGTDGPQFS